MIVGVLLGIVIGLLSGVVLLALLKTMAEASIKDASSLITVTTEALAIPTFMFGGLGAATKLLGGVGRLDGFLLSYLTVLTTVFVAIVIVPLCKWILRLGIELGQLADKSNE
jgi:hypothetical protein